MEIDKMDLLPLSYLKKARYTGSFQGMRYAIEKAEEGEDLRLRLFVWKEPFSFENTEEKEKEIFFFPFSTEGIEEIRQFLSKRAENA